MEFDDYYSSPPSIRLVNTGDNSMIMLQLVDWKFNPFVKLHYAHWKI